MDIAISLYHDIEQHAFDAKNNGYIEALTREWNPIADMRLSDKDENGSRTMNTHLHIIEPYTNLYRVWKTPELEKSILNLLDIFTDKLLNTETYHLDLFFNDEWEGKRNIESYGHDIEASWLLHETAQVSGNVFTTTPACVSNSSNVTIKLQLPCKAGIEYKNPSKTYICLDFFVYPDFLLYFCKMLN